MGDRKVGVFFHLSLKSTAAQTSTGVAGGFGDIILCRPCSTGVAED